jgi:hypothetical protein
VLGVLKHGRQASEKINNYCYERWRLWQFIFDDNRIYEVMKQVKGDIHADL